MRGVKHWVFIGLLAAVLASLGCGNPIAVAELGGGMVAAPGIPMRSRSIPTPTPIFRRASSCSSPRRFNRCRRPRRHGITAPIRRATIPMFLNVRILGRLFPPRRNEGDEK